MLNQTVRTLRTRGFSLREISTNLGVPYSTVRRRCKHVVISKRGRSRYHKKVPGVIKYVHISPGLSKTKVRIIMNLLFDGAVYCQKGHYTMTYVNGSREMVDEFVADMKKAYHTEPSSIEVGQTYSRVKYYSKLIYINLTTHMRWFSTSNTQCKIPQSILAGGGLYKRIILRAFWENEGSIAKDGKLSADLMSYAVIMQLSALHNEFNLKHGISRYWKNGWAYKLFLLKTKENYQNFLDLGLFSKAIATKGYFVGIKKADILRTYYNHKYAKSEHNRTK